MTRTASPSRVSNRASRSLVAIVCAALLAPGEAVFLAQAAPPAQAPAAATEAKLSPDQLDALVAPIALYPDPLLAQTLAATHELFRDVCVLGAASAAARVAQAAPDDSTRAWNAAAAAAGAIVLLDRAWAEVGLAACPRTLVL